MFEQKRLVFWYAVSPVHMGAGTAVGGLIDNPIQREVHTQHPVFAGSGLKGALREVAEREWSGDDVQVIFGPDSGHASDHAGALAVSDAQIVAFPVRALKEAFVHVTSPACLARLKRLAQVAGIAADWEVPAAPDEGKAKLLNSALMSDDQLILEAFAYAADMEQESEPLGKVASWLAENVLPSGKEHEEFAKRLRRNLVLLRDEDFNHFVRFGTVVEPHVRIDNDTGTADDGGLFYTENLPPETVMTSLLMATRGRKKKKEQEESMPAVEIMEKAAALLDGQLMQVGGDATTGRGLVITRVLATEATGTTAEAAE